MSHKTSGPEAALPLQLQLCILEAELENIQSDLDRLQIRRDELLQQIRHYRTELTQVQGRTVLRRVK